MKEVKTLQNLPDAIRIHTLQNKETGVWIAELVDYDVCTEADSFLDLIDSVNDLIYTFFDIPQKLQSQVVYLPSAEDKQKASAQNLKSLQNQMTFNILISPHLNYQNA